MKPLILLLALSLTGMAGSGVQPKPDGQTAAELPPLPPLIRLGLGMMGGNDAAPVVGACECHSPFGFIGGDRIVSVDGKKVFSNRGVWLALGLARPKRSVEFVIRRPLDPTHDVKVVVEFSPDWWLVPPVKK